VGICTGKSLTAQRSDKTGPQDEAVRLTDVFRAEAEFVWRVVRRFGVPEADAEDAVQEVFLVVAKRLDAYEERGALRAWLVAIARQVAQHAQRARFRHERKVQALPEREPHHDPEQRLAQNEALAFVNAFLAELDRDQAMVFYLADVEGLGVPEIAASLGIKLNTAYGRLRLARVAFEKKVAKHR
jgi:RNA polymerase sigma-70 factor (ECF subfamily)